MKNVYFLLIFLFICNILLAQADSNIVIKSATKNIDISYNTKTKKVEVVEKVNISYIAKKSNANFVFTEFYDEKTKIQKVNYTIDNKRNVSNWKPQDSYYQSNDIFYSDARVSYFDLNLPKVGSELSITYERVTDDPRYFAVVYFSENYSVNFTSIIVTIPKWFKADIKEFNFDGFDIEKSEEDLDGKKITTYKGKGLNAFKSESFTRGNSYTYPHILILSKSASGPINEEYFIDLSSQFKWYKSILLPEIELESVKTKAQEIIGTAKTDQEKINLIYYWIQDNVRYIAFENGIAGFRPDYASEVLKKKYGDCKGMANLACQMLKSVGIDARLSWLGTNHIAYDYSTPCLYVDNHMICAVMKDGKPILIDPTETYLSINESAERIQNREILIDNGDNYILYKNPERSYQQNLIFINNTLIVDGNNLVGNGKYLMKGESKSGFLNGYNSIKTNKIGESLANYINNDDVNYEVKITKQPDLINYHKDIDLAYSLNYKNAITRFDNEIYVDLDHNKEFKSLNLEKDKRLADVFFSFKHFIKYQSKLIIPEGYTLKSKPSDLNIDNPDYKLKANYVANGNEITYEKEIIIKNSRIKKSKISQLQKDFEALNQFYQETLTLSK